MTYFYKSKLDDKFKKCTCEYDAARYKAYGYIVKTFAEMSIDERKQIQK